MFELLLFHFWETMPEVIFVILKFKSIFLQVELCVTNQTDSPLGPFEVFLSHVNSTQEKAVMVNGIQKLVTFLVLQCVIPFII